MLARRGERQAVISASCGPGAPVAGTHRGGRLHCSLAHERWEFALRTASDVCHPQEAHWGPQPADSVGNTAYLEMRKRERETYVPFSSFPHDI